jgi:predicted PolB exonuclease-like 3'-5' exonuclease
VKISPNSSRRNIFIDIETVTLNQEDPKGALSAASGRIACVCLLIDDGETIIEESLADPDEARIITSFWNLVYAGDVFIGHNAFGFDLPFIRQRSWILGIRPSRRIDLRRYYTNDVIDTMETWSNWGATKFVGLDKLGELLTVGTKTAHGSDVANWWAAGDLNRIADYCREDVRLTYRIFCRLMFQNLPERYYSAIGSVVDRCVAQESAADNRLPQPGIGAV